MVSYSRLHAIIRAKIPVPDKCPKCNSTRKLDICNISGKYLDDVSDWEYMCRRCHIIGDGRVAQIQQYLKLGRRTGWHHSKESIEKMSRLAAGKYTLEKNPNYSKPCPDWLKQKLRDLRLGQTMPEETKEKIRQSVIKTKSKKKI